MVVVPAVAAGCVRKLRDHHHRRACADHSLLAEASIARSSLCGTPGRNGSCIASSHGLRPGDPRAGVPATERVDSGKPSIAIRTNAPNTPLLMLSALLVGTPGAFFTLAAVGPGD